MSGAGRSNSWTIQTIYTDQTTWKPDDAPAASTRNVESGGAGWSGQTSSTTSAIARAANSCSGHHVKGASSSMPTSSMPTTRYLRTIRVGGGGGGASGRVTVLAATNVPEAIDAAFLRPGRFDHAIYCPPPDARHRAAVLSEHAAAANVVVTTAASGAAADDDDDDDDDDGGGGRKEGGGQRAGLAGLVDRLVAATEGFTVADLGHLTRCALFRAVARTKERQEGSEGEGGGAEADKPPFAVLPSDYDAALLSVRPSVSVEARRRYEKWRLPTLQ